MSIVQLHYVNMIILEKIDIIKGGFVSLCFSLLVFL